MVYRKNITSVEQVISVVAGIAIVLYGIFSFTRYAWAHPWGYVIVASGLIFVVRGFVGFCPTCWMFGRKFLS